MSKSIPPDEYLNKLTQDAEKIMGFPVVLSEVKAKTVTKECEAAKEVKKILKAITGGQN